MAAPKLDFWRVAARPGTHVRDSEALFYVENRKTKRESYHQQINPSFCVLHSSNKSLIRYIYPLPARHNTFSHTQNRPKPMSCMKRNTGQAITGWILGLQIREFWSKFANSAALPTIPHTPTNPNRAKPMRALLPKHAATFRTIARKTNKSEARKRSRAWFTRATQSPSSKCRSSDQFSEFSIQIWPRPR